MHRTRSIVNSSGALALLVALFVAAPAVSAVDTTAPSTPVVTDDGAYTASTTQLHASWTVDPSIRPREYRYQIRRGSPRQGTVIVSWTSTGLATSVTHGNLVLEPHASYYFGVRARDRSGRWTSVGYSDGITVNRPPLVEAAVDAVAEGGATVRLDGSRTVDPDGDALRYAWRQTEGPSVILTSLSEPVTRFTAPFTRYDTPLGFELAVSDGVYTEAEASAVMVQQVAPPTVSIAVDDAVVSAGQPFTLTVSGTSPAGLAAVWWWGENTGITSATVTLTYPPSPTSSQVFTTPVVNPTKLDRAFGSPLFSAEQAVTSYTFTSQVTIPQAGTYQFGANSRDVFYAIAGEAHQASEGMGIPYVTVTVASDTTPPTGTLQINSDATYANVPTVTLTLSAVDPQSGMGPGAEMSFSNDGITYAAPEPYASTKTWVLSNGDGEKTVFVKFKDAAGNWSSAASDTIVLDTNPPTLEVLTPSPDSQVTGASQ